MKPHANPAHRAVLDELLLALPGVVARPMFGYPAWAVGGKVFACVYGDAVALKLPAERARALLDQADVVPFQPLGRAPMAEWVQIHRTCSDDYRLDLDLFVAARAHVAALPATRKR